MTLSAEYVREHLNKLFAFLEPMHAITESNLGSFFTDNLWHLVPVNIQKELNNADSLDNFIQFYPNIVKKCPKEFAECHPHVLYYINTAVNLSILHQDDFVCDFQSLFLKNDYTDRQIHLTSPVMTEKKLHEVQIAAKITALLSKHTQSSHVIDVGAGKGYLSSILALNYECNVLGLEMSQEKTKGAIKRSKLIARNVKNDSKGGKLRRDLVQRQYKQAVIAVGSNTDISEVLREHFTDVAGITLTGLHTCGDLSPECLKMFLDNEEIRGLLNVGCCYHYISEEFCDRKGEKTSPRFGFPLSLYLKRRKCFLGRNARMLSAHSLDRISSELGSTQTSLLHRAILETVLRKHNYHPDGDFVKLPKRVTKCENFHQFIQQSLKHLNFNIQLTEREMNDLYEAHKDKKPLLTAYFLLRVTLAPVVESIILLDRILYLIENGISNAYLVRLFNLETSPRGFGVIAWKD